MAIPFSAYLGLARMLPEEMARMPSIDSLGGDSPQGAVASGEEVRAHWQAAAERGSLGGGLGLYCHLPFCASRCRYCHCFTSGTASAGEVREHLRLLLVEMELWRPVFAKRRFTNAYIGGGTPAGLSPAELGRLLGGMRRSFRFSSDAQCTVEATPRTADPERLAVLRAHGVDRLSLGVQSLDRTVLAASGRGWQTRGMVERVYRCARKAGFSIVNGDLMAGLEGQSVASFLDDAKVLARMGFDTVHVYFFDPRDTPFQRAGGVVDQSWSSRRKAMLDAAGPTLEAFGYRTLFPGETIYGRRKGAVNRYDFERYYRSGSVLGLGWRADSHVFPGTHYTHLSRETWRDNLIAGRLPPARWHRGGRDLEMREAMVLLLRGGVDPLFFRRLFGCAPEEAFPEEIIALRKAGRLQEGSRRVRALFGSPEEYLAIALHFFPRQALAGAARLHLRRPGGPVSPVESHEAYKGRDLLLRPTSACNQRCPFCFVPRGGPAARADIESALADLAARVAPGGALTISGGEPLADPRLEAIVRSARRKGMREFVLQTNAIGLDRPGRLDALVQLGVRHYFVSFHSHKPAHYDRITGSRGLYPRAVRALATLLKDPRCLVTCHTVVNAWNYRDLPGLVGFIGRLARSVRRTGPEERGAGEARTPVTVAFSMINGVGHEKASGMAVDLAAAGPWLDRAVERCAAWDLAVHPFAGETAPPPCVLSRPGDHVSPRDLPQDRVRYAEDGSCAALVGGRVKCQACRDCPCDGRCLGVPAEYARLFGLGALGSRSLGRRLIHREAGRVKPGLARRKAFSHHRHASQ